MKRALVICLFLSLGAQAANCAAVYFPPLQAANSGATMQQQQKTNNYNFEDNKTRNDSNRYGDSAQSSYDDDTSSFLPAEQVADANVGYPRINEIEQSLYGKTYPKQDIQVRLARIEKSLFSTSYPNMSLSQRVDNIMMNFNESKGYPNISKNGLTKLESKLLDRTYPQDNPQNRIERIEQTLFGATQSGDLLTRYNTIKSAAANANKMSANPYDSIYQDGMPTPKTGLKGFFGNIGSALMGGGLMGGTMTGFTPSIDPYGTCGMYGNPYGGGLYNQYGSNRYGGFNAMNNPYSRMNRAYSGNLPSSGSGMYRGYRSNHGYSDSFNSYGSGAGVTILD